MSYTALGNPLGSYYEFEPHQIFGGYGAFGAETTFNAQQVWVDAQLGGSCYTPGSPNFEKPAMISTCNAAGGRATREIQAALNTLGYATP
ncbi:MAG: hypothetical protein V3S01_08310, partial [Dehalococcoidia bacterium]